MKAIAVVLTGWMLVFLCGCQAPETVKTSPADQIKQLQQENTQLTGQIEQSETQNENLKEQLKVLSGIKSKAKLDDLYELKRIKVTGYTNLYDKDKDGKYEQLIVYIQPLDVDNDVVKAPGKVDVQLWDLDRENGQALLGQWSVEPGELKKSWFSIMIINYRLIFDVSDKVEQYTSPLTVKVTFTDYLTGKVFKQQRMIKPL